MAKDLRQEMPSTAAFLDSLRNTFGADMINGQIRQSVKNGKPTFWARENGNMLGTRDTSANSVLMWDEQGISYWATPDWVHDARALAVKVKVDIKPADPDDLDGAEREADELRALIQAVKARRKSADVCTQQGDEA